MSPQQRSLPLFPLNVVLFPNAVIPLHVFEERYKLMVQRCLDSDSRFGVVLIKSGDEVGGPADPHSIGTLARIAEVERFDDGRMLLSVVGEKRFRILELTEREPYLEGLVEVLDEDVDVSLTPAEISTIREAVTRHVRLLLGLGGGWTREATMPDAPVALSYFIGSVLQSGLPEKQALLEEPSTAKRLEAELLMLEREAVELRERVARELGERGASRQ